MAQLHVAVAEFWVSRTHRSYFAHRVKPPTQPLTPISSCYIHSTRSSSAAWRMNLVRAGKSVLLYKTASQFRVMELFFLPPEERVTPRSPHSSITLWFLTLQSPEVFIRISLFLPLSLSHHHTITDGLKGMFTQILFVLLVIMFSLSCNFECHEVLEWQFVA